MPGAPSSFFAPSSDALCSWSGVCGLVEQSILADPNLQLLQFLRIQGLSTGVDGREKNHRCEQ